nr:hypothetical protein [Brevundimonas diminuta]
MADTPRVTVPVEPTGISPVYNAAYDSIRKGAPGLSDATCAAIARSINMKVAHLSAAPAPEGGATKLHLKLLDTLKPFAEVAEKLKHCHVVEICEPTPENPSRNIIPIPREWFERAADDLEAIAIQLHGAGALSEGQASKLTGLDRVEVRKLSDALATREEAPERRECDDCGFKGTSDDASKEQDYCTACGGNSQAGGPDECAHCGAKNHMVMACPKCGGRFSLDEDAREEAPACKKCSGKGYTEHEGGEGEGYPSRPEIEACSCREEAPAPTCQRCGGEIAGWCCQNCPAEFRENDDGVLIFDDREAPEDAERVVVKTPCEHCLRQTSVTPESLASYRDTIGAQPQAREDAQPVAWACLTCNSPRAVDPCPKCGTALTEPAKGWVWPRTPDVARIRALAREVGYAIGVHGTMERDLDLILAPWVAEAVTPLELAQHIAPALGGNVLAYKVQDKPCGRWSCNINANGWFKLIDLSVMPPTAHPAPDALRVAVEALEQTPAIEALTPTNREWVECVSVQDRYDLMKRRLGQALAALQAEQKGGAE